MTMGGIVAGMAAIHAPMMANAPELAPAAQRERVFGAFRALGASLREARPDLLLVVANDHFNNFFLDNMPAFCLGIGEAGEGPMEWWMPLQRRRIPIHQPFARALLRAAVAEGFDLAFSEKLRLDHSVMLPLQLMGAPDVPIVPLLQNCFIDPMPTPRRCLALGRLIRQVAEAGPWRVAVLGTGGMSHWVGVPRMCEVNEAFDRRVLDLISRGDAEGLAGLTDPEIEAAGNGAHEIRNWITAVGATPGHKGRTLAYEVVPPWVVGAGVVALEV